MKPSRIQWTLDPDNPVIRPGQVNGKLDADHAGACHVLRLGERYRMYYWGRGERGNVICVAQSPIDRPNDWQGLGYVLEAEPDTEHNAHGPSFPYVVPVDERLWHMYFGAWGRARQDGKLPNTTCLAISEDAGCTWRYHTDNPILAPDRPYDESGSGSVCVVRQDGEFRMYYTAIGEYYPIPAGVEVSHGPLLPRIGVAYAVSDDGINWKKPLDDLMIAPRAFDHDRYEYISSKPFILEDGDTWRMWISSCSPRYRIHSLRSPDGLAWEWNDSGPLGELGIGDAGAFDDVQRSYAAVVRHGDEYRMWYTGNNFGGAGMGYAVGRLS